VPIQCISNDKSRKNCIRLLISNKHHVKLVNRSNQVTVKLFIIIVIIIIITISSSSTSGSSSIVVVIVVVVVVVV